MKKSLNIIVPVMALPLLALSLWSFTDFDSKATSRAIASEAKEDIKKEDNEGQVKKLQDIIECQQKYIADLKTEMNKKIDDLKNVLTDRSIDTNKKPDQRRPDEKDNEDQAQFVQRNNDQIVQMMMYLTSLIQNQSHNQAAFAYRPAVAVPDWMVQENEFYRVKYENQLYSNIGMGQNYFHQQMNPYQQTPNYLSTYRSNGFNFNTYMANQDYKPMPIMGDEFIFHSGSSLVRQPSSRAFQF